MLLNYCLQKMQKANQKEKEEVLVKEMHQENGKKTRLNARKIAQHCKKLAITDTEEGKSECPRIMGKNLQET